jgi:hypothetical protein
VAEWSKAIVYAKLFAPVPGESLFLKALRIFRIGDADLEIAVV